jgi:hypothetical protein
MIPRPDGSRRVPSGAALATSAYRGAPARASSAITSSRRDAGRERHCTVTTPDGLRMSAPCSNA